MLELSIDWPSLFSAFQMNMPELRCFFCLDDGSVLKLPPGSPELESVRKESKRYVPVEVIPSRIQYQWICDFTATLDEDGARSRVEAAINGKGAFRRFKDILLTMPEERKQWFDYRDQRMRSRIVEWVGEHNIIPLNPAPWSDDGIPEEAPPTPAETEIIATISEWAKSSPNAASLSPDDLQALADAIDQHLK